MVQVVQVVLMVVGLLLKADVEVGLEAIAVFGEQEEPFEHIPQIEADVEQFTLLGGVDALVVEFRGIELLHGEDDAEEVDGIEATHEGETLDVDYLRHLQGYIRILFAVSFAKVVDIVHKLVQFPVTVGREI